MSLWHIAWSYLWNRKLTTGLTILSVALGVGLISAVLTLRDETQRRFEEEGQAFDVVIGSKGNFNWCWYGLFSRCTHRQY